MLWYKGLRRVWLIPVSDRKLSEEHNERVTCQDVVPRTFSIAETKALETLTKFAKSLPLQYMATGMLMASYWTV